MATKQDALMIWHLLRDKRADRPKTEVADKIGVSRQMYSQWETGHAVPGDEWVKPLMAYLKMAEDDVVMMLYRSRQARQALIIHAVSTTAKYPRDWFPGPIEAYAEAS